MWGDDGGEVQDERVETYKRVERTDEMKAVSQETAEFLQGIREVDGIRSFVEGVLGNEPPSPGQWGALRDLMGGLTLNCDGDHVIPDEEFTVRDEANSLSSLCFRNCGPLEDWHAEGRPIRDPEMKVLNITSSERMTAALLLKEKAPTIYRDALRCYNAWLCHGWER